jgi:hypothetical protein
MASWMTSQIKINIVKRRTITQIPQKEDFWKNKNVNLVA